MSNNIFYSADYNNENFTGLFDRIINIKFKRRNGETFTLRSDYEPVWEGSSLYFKTCQPKPEIRVQYVQYQATMINVDIFITNLNVIEYKDNKTKAAVTIENPISSGAKSGLSTNLPNDLLSRLGNPVVEAEIEMGYRGNFHSWAKERPTVLTQEQLYKSFLNLEIPSSDTTQKQLIDAQSLFKAHRKCHVTIEWATHTGNPPDRVTQFHGYVGVTEAGFQPYAIKSIDDNTLGESGQITRDNILKCLNDSHAPIDFVETKETVEITKKIKAKKGTKVIKKISTSTKTSYRNFFNGGKPFTLLEGYCFHTVTRRFIRPSISSKRNSLLEQAALEYALASNYPNAKQQLSEKRKEIAQQVYRTEQIFSSANFKEENGILDYTSSADEAYKETLEQLINKQMINTYVGARYTVKNLPEQRKLYKAIRNVLTAAAAKKQYMAWWEAAEQLNTIALKEAPQLPSETLVAENIQSVRQYLLEAESGKLKTQDYYFKNGLGKDWILPVQNSEQDAVLKNSNQKDVFFYPPTKVSDKGYTETDKSVKKRVRCFAGLFEIRDSYLFGLPVLCSEKASKVFEKQQAGKTYIDFIFLPNAQAQIEWICKTWNLMYYVLHNGTFYIYEPSEDARETAGQEFITNQSSAPVKLPAVYDITLGPLRKIRMPFIAFLDPMTMIEWNSTAAIGEMISFYYQPEKGRNFFTIIKNEIDFSTTEDYNTMEIEVVDTQWRDKTEIPAAVLNQENKKTYTKVIIIPDEQTDTWQKIYESPIGKIPVELIELWGERTEDKNTSLSNDGRVSPLQFFTLMSTWNPSLFTESTEKETGWDWIDGYQRVDKKADNLYGKARPNPKIHFPDIMYCKEKLTDATLKRIFMKFPFMPNESGYTNEYDDKYVLVYQQGVWEMILKETVKANYQIEVA